MSGVDGSSSPTSNDEAEATRAKRDGRLGRDLLFSSASHPPGLAAADLVSPALPSGEAGPYPRRVKRPRVAPPESDSESVFVGRSLVESDVPCLPCVYAAIRGSGKAHCLKFEGSTRCLQCSFTDSCLRCDPTPAVACAAVAELRKLLVVSDEEQNPSWLTDVAAARNRLRYMLSNAEALTEAVLAEAEKEKTDKQEEKSKKEEKKKAPLGRYIDRFMRRRQECLLVLLTMLREDSSADADAADVHLKSMVHSFPSGHHCLSEPRIPCWTVHVSPRRTPVLRPDVTKDDPKWREGERHGGRNRPF
ncbi:hypothetical protein LY76DRAFT_606507 [Colletotrichum caudatum]|nr:hypothetical protein LY76DRAFT_606507 [Colletotrichum caudatum]